MIIRMGLFGGRYRVRTWLRKNLPYFISDRIPKGRRDCGNHDWYRQDEETAACYHCEVGKRSLKRSAELHPAGTGVEQMEVKDSDRITIKGEKSHSWRARPRQSRKSKSRVPN